MEIINTHNKEISIPKIQQITALIAFILSGILILHTIYNQFFYVDGMWMDGFIANGFAFLNELIWIVVLLLLKSFFNKTLYYSKANQLIIAYVIFLGITTVSLALVVFQSLKYFVSTEDTQSISSLTAFATTSILGFVLVFVSNFSIILICILLGNKIRKIDYAHKNLFKALGFSFIIYGLISLFVTLNIIENDAIQLIIKAILAVLIGLIVKKSYNSNTSNFPASQPSKSQVNLNQTAPQYKNEVSPENLSKIKDKINKEFEVHAKTKNIETTNQKPKEIPIININNIENKELALSYYENLSKEELNRLEFIVSKEFHDNLTKEQLNLLVKQHIADNKLYDHQRFLPK